MKLYYYIGVIALIALTASSVHGGLTEVPLNDARMVGETVVLNCAAAAGTNARVMWTEFITNPSGAVIADGRTVLPSHPNASQYSILGTGDTYNLQIATVGLYNGGRYFCQDINSGGQELYRGWAELTVLASDPVCTDFPNILGSLIEGVNYDKECEVDYQGNYSPNMSWVGPGEYHVDQTITPTNVWSRISITAQREIEGGRFNLSTNIYVPPQLPPDYATNTPDYEYNFFGQTVVVSWGPQNMSVSPIKNEYQVGDVLTCYADSKPAPTYRWTNMRTLVTADPGQTFTITQDLEGFEQSMRCNANVLIEGSLYTNDVFVNVSVPAPTTFTTPPTTQPTTTPPADAPCDDLTGHWSSTNPNAHLCIEVDSKGNILTLIRNGTDPFFVAGNGKVVYGDYKHVGFTGLWPPGSGGVAGFTGECHKCDGQEVILFSGLSRDKDEAPGCGESSGTHLTRLYVMTRYGPPCTGMDVDVYNPTNLHIEKMQIPDHRVIKRGQRL